MFGTSPICLGKKMWGLLGMLNVAQINNSFLFLTERETPFARLFHQTKKKWVVTILSPENIKMCMWLPTINYCLSALLLLPGTCMQVLLRTATVPLLQ
jgi:hypothetical protein